MLTPIPYIFGFKSGMPPEIAEQQNEAMAFERFLSHILTPEQMQKREQIRRMEYAVWVVVDGIMEKYF